MGRPDAAGLRTAGFFIELTSLAMLSPLAATAPPTFRTHDESLQQIRAACTDTDVPASFHDIGESREGRPLGGVVLGEGPLTVSLIAGAHADEPVGPETLRTLVLAACDAPEALADLLQQVRFLVVPHINPDGEARNRSWMDAWPSLSAYLQERVREKPGDDLEFGFPTMRPENRAVSRFLRRYGPMDLHLSLHGMGVSEGFFLLIERHWGFRTEALQDALKAEAEQMELGLHDHNRQGEKGFFYLGPGFNTTPEGTAMRTFFRAKNNPKEARRFHQSSMEFVRSLGGDPLCLVTELPLFRITPTTDTSGTDAPGRPATYLACRQALAELALASSADSDGALEEVRARFGLAPLPLREAIRLQLLVIMHGITTAQKRFR